MVVFDTEEWEGVDRVERWREQFGRSVIRSEVLAQGERPQDFAVRMAMLGGPLLTSLSMRLRSVRKIRDRSWFGDGADNLTLMFCQAGTVRYDTNEVRRILRPGEATIFSHTVPVDLSWDAAQISTIQVPRNALVELSDLDPLAGRVLGRDNGARAMLAVYLAELWRQGGALTPRAERHLLDLALEGLTGTGLSRDPPTARFEPRIAAIRAVIRSHAQGDLRVGQVGATVGVSARTVERDLAALGTSFADELTAARLDAAMAQLNGPARISDIAYAVGFNDLSAFNRRFKARFGHTPREERAIRRSKR